MSLIYCRSQFGKAKLRFQKHHDQIPYLRKLPAAVVAIILFIIVVNLICWAGAGVALHFNKFVHAYRAQALQTVQLMPNMVIPRPLVGTALLSYVLGLRHALDADHIAAIDLMTRRLIAAGQKPVTVGTFFSLGHSTVVVITSIAVAATAAQLSEKIDGFSKIGGIIGSSVSAAFMILLGVMNVYILYKLIKEMKLMLKGDQPQTTNEFTVSGSGPLFRLFKKAFKLIDRPWKMYPLGFLFGLGFDTSSEIALLGIASIQAAKGTSIWYILIFPVLFTAGMCLLDTIDGALMSALYTSSSLARDRLGVLYYSIVFTAVTVIVAMLIGTLQLLNLILNVSKPTGRFWDGVRAAGDSYDIIGGCIIGLFAVSAITSVVLYQPWKRRIDKKRRGSNSINGAETSTAEEKSREKDAETSKPTMEGQQPSGEIHIEHLHTPETNGTTLNIEKLL